MVSLSLNFQQALRQLGFSIDEIKIIGFLFYEKKAGITEISKQTAISYSTIHYLMANLERKDIVKCLHKKDEIFEICSEKDFIYWIREQKKVNQEIYNNAESDMQSFFSTVKETVWKPDILYYEGKEAVIEIYEDMLKTNEDIYCWTDIRKIHDTLGEEYIKDFIKRRSKKNIKTYAIMPENDTNKKRDQKEEKRESKFVKNLPINGEVRIYGNNVSVISFDKNKPVGIVLKGGVITSLFEIMFKKFWKES
ncbi:winged helix-turn-helix transcriptional regulator [Candidatus Peregrinibacteria bacterium]|jgi:sugar-specific transcriptional regulator TrmB|nr:winged helix-turn-helix transcriptional regulator [Candidatus Peregrinibacteria bacterium]